jgi:hypothetical protein
MDFGAIISIEFIPCVERHVAAADRAMASGFVL